MSQLCYIINRQVSELVNTSVPAIRYFCVSGARYDLTLSTLGKNFSRLFEICFFFFPQKISFNISCKLSPQVEETIFA